MAFEGLSAKLQEVTRKLRGKARITESDLKEILRKSFRTGCVKIFNSRPTSC